MPKVIDETLLFQTAMKVLMSKGYSAATTREIAALSSVNEATLFRRYGTKAGLYTQAINRLLSGTPLNHLEYTGNLEDDIRAIVNAYLETYTSNGDIVSMIFMELPRYAELKPVTETLFKNLQPSIEIFRRYQEDGRLTPNDPTNEMAALIGPLMILKTIQKTELATATSEINPSAYVEIFLKGRMQN